MAVGTTERVEEEKRMRIHMPRPLKKKGVQ